MFPYEDSVPSSRRPIVTWILISINVYVFIYELLLAVNGQLNGIIDVLYLVPYRLIHEFGPNQILACFSSMFLHAGFFHLIANIWYLFIFGDNVEDSMGSLRFLPFYLLCGVIGGVVFALFNQNSYIGAVGASGAISGVLGAYFVLYPHAKVKTSAWGAIYSLFGFGPVNYGSLRTMWIPAYIFIGLWFVLQGLFAFIQTGGGGGVAFLAHIGGFVAGALLVKIFTLGRQRKIGLKEWDTVNEEKKNPFPMWLQLLQLVVIFSLFGLACYSAIGSLDFSSYVDFLQGREANTKHKYSQAIVYFDKSIERSPGSVAAYWERGIAHKGLSHYRQALHDFSMVAQLNPQMKGLNTRIADVYLGLKQYARAIELYDQDLSRWPRHSDALSGRGMAFLRLKERDRAERDFLEAISLTKNDVRAFEGLGILYYDEGKYQQALDAANQARDIDSENEQARNICAQIYFKEAQLSLKDGEYIDAIKSLKSAIGLLPQNIEYRIELAKACIECEGYEMDAINYLTDGLKLNPNEVKLLDLRSKCYRKIGWSQLAEKDRASLKLLTVKHKVPHKHR